LSRAEKQAEHSHQAELYRLRGELVWQLTGDREKAEMDFMEAANVARRQQARSYELRALNSLCQHRLDGETRALLASAYAWFTEGFDTEDLWTARQYLEAKQ
jgi:predicted ATPase